ncbi:MAG TPA: hypothetical protein VKI64_03960 [Acidimicrobiales bacterium]|nr:hypothetical protein [Acidimicrobiales bacterium]
MPTTSTSNAGRPTATSGCKASRRALSLLGPVRWTELMIAWYSGGMACGEGAAPPAPVGGLSEAGAPGGGVDEPGGAVVVVPTGGLDVLVEPAGKVVGVPPCPALVVVVEPGSGGVWARAASPPARAARLSDMLVRAATTAARVRDIRRRGDPGFARG